MRGNMANTNNEGENCFVFIAPYILMLSFTAKLWNCAEGFARYCLAIVCINRLCKIYHTMSGCIYKICTCSWMNLNRVKTCHPTLLEGHIAATNWDIWAGKDQTQP